jgi:hypothetical protein
MLSHRAPKAILRFTDNSAKLNVFAGPLSALLKRPHSIIGMIESNQRQVIGPEFVAIAEAIGVDPVELFRQVLREREWLTFDPRREQSDLEYTEFRRIFRETQPIFFARLSKNTGHVTT